MAPEHASFFPLNCGRPESNLCPQETIVLLHCSYAWCPDILRNRGQTTCHYHIFILLRYHLCKCAFISSLDHQHIHTLLREEYTIQEFAEDSLQQHDRSTQKCSRCSISREHFFISLYATTVHKLVNFSLFLHTAKRKPAIQITVVSSSSYSQKCVHARDEG